MEHLRYTGDEFHESELWEGEPTPAPGFGRSISKAAVGRHAAKSKTPPMSIPSKVPECDKSCCWSFEDDKGRRVIPPHEWVARRQGRRVVFSTSVCEGAGRTLKGRDLCRVRNDVLRRTGFLEPDSGILL